MFLRALRVSAILPLVACSGEFVPEALPLAESTAETQARYVGAMAGETTHNGRFDAVLTSQFHNVVDGITYVELHAEADHGWSMVGGELPEISVGRVSYAPGEIDFLGCFGDVMGEPIYDEPAMSVVVDAQPVEVDGGLVLEVLIEATFDADNAADSVFYMPWTGE